MVLITGIVAVRGLTAWRDQLVGKRKVELAERVLIDFYNARDALKQWRWPNTVFITETKEGDQAQRLGHYRTTIESLTQKLFSRLHASRYTFQAYFGKTDKDPFLEISGVRDEIFRKAEEWPVNICDIDKRIDAAVKDIEALCKPILQARPLTKRLVRLFRVS
jgi:hypothetical protein